MRTKPKSKSEKIGSDLIFWRNIFGAVIRITRGRLGWSTQRLADETGLAASELGRIENGDQECRLDSFIRITSALGLNAGALLDLVVTSSFAFFDRRIRGGDEIDVVCTQWEIANTPEIGLVSGDFACIAAVASHLLRASDPVRIASGIQYPEGSELSSLLAGFARRVSGFSFSKRVTYSSLLRDKPIQFLRTNGLLDEVYHKERIEAWRRERIGVRGLSVANSRNVLGLAMWLPLYAPTLGGDANKGVESIIVDTLTVASYTSGRTMKNLWTPWQKSLGQLCEPQGTQARLARDLGVSRQIVSRWVSGNAEPSADFALRLIEWIKAEEAVAET